MIAAFAVLLVAAICLGGYIAYMEIRKRREAACAAEEAAFELARNYLSTEYARKAGNTTPSQDGNGPVLADNVRLSEIDAVSFDTTDDLTYISEDTQSGTVIKPSELREHITVQEADSLMQDEVAASLIEKSVCPSDRTKTEIINIDTIAQYFDSGEVVTLEKIIERVPSVSSKTTYLKVLARGTLDKPLTVEADSFSLQAVKMIVLTGGKVVTK